MKEIGFSMGICVVINGESTWLKPSELYEIGKLNKTPIFLKMSEEGIIKFYQGTEEFSNDSIYI